MADLTDRISNFLDDASHAIGLSRGRRRKRRFEEEAEAVCQRRGSIEKATSNEANEKTPKLALAGDALLDDSVLAALAYLDFFHKAVPLRRQCPLSDGCPTWSSATLCAKFCLHVQRVDTALRWRQAAGGGAKEDGESHFRSVHMIGATMAKGLAKFMGQTRMAGEKELLKAATDGLSEKIC